MKNQINQNILRDLPGVDAMLNNSSVASLIEEHGLELVTNALRKSIDFTRDCIILGKKDEVCETEIIDYAKNIIKTITDASLKPVINATGIVIHTNIGRSPLGEKTVDDISKVLSGYSNLEFDLSSGQRGKRDAHITELIKYITGAEDAVVVNNNAAAIVLTLNTLAKDKEVIISRGELIEIGGSFRINEIMEASGSKMCEVGSTNKTRISDYENALSSKTALIFKAHKSNYAIKGFTEEVGIKGLSSFALSKGIPFFYDLGSGLLRKPDNLNLSSEPDVRSVLKDGVDLVCFSADKLLGGPQAGIIAGKKELIARIKKAPLYRAFRVGKITIAALQSICRSYLRDDTLTDIPIFSMLKRSQNELRNSANKLKDLFDLAGINSEIIENRAFCGGGTLPEHEIKSFAVKLKFNESESKQDYASKLFYKLLKIDEPILGILRKGEILFDVLTILEKDLGFVALQIVRNIVIPAEAGTQTCHSREGGNPVNRSK